MSFPFASPHPTPPRVHLQIILMAEQYLVSFVFFSVGQRTWVAGWGATDPESANRPKILQVLILCIQVTLDQQIWIVHTYKTGCGGCCHRLWRLWGLAQGKGHKTHIVQRDGNTLSDQLDFLDIQGFFFNCSHPKNPKCQPVSKFCHLELFWWDLQCNLTLRNFWVNS